MTNDRIHNIYPNCTKLADIAVYKMNTESLKDFVREVLVERYENCYQDFLDDLRRYTDKDEEWEE